MCQIINKYFQLFKHLFISLSNARILQYIHQSGSLKLRQQIQYQRQKQRNSFIIILTDKGFRSSMNSKRSHKQVSSVARKQIDRHIIDLYRKSVGEIENDKPKLWQIQGLDQINKADKLQIGENKMQDITRTLELQLITRLAYIERMKDKDDFANFTFNPFSLEQHRTEFKSSYQVNKKQRINIIEGVEQTRKRHKMAFIKEKISKVHHSMDIIHMNMMNKKKKQKQQSNDTNQKTTVNKPIKTPINKQFSFLDQLVSSKQEEELIFKIKDKSLNIFKVRTTGQEKYIVNCKEVLKSLFFCDNSIMHDRQNKLRAKCFKQISSVARKFITNQNHLVEDDHRILSTDMIINCSHIFFEEIMLVSTGVLQPLQLRKNLDGLGKIIQKDDEDIIVNYRPVDQLFYDQNVQHKSSSIRCELPDNLLKKQLTDYSLTPKQQQQYIFSTNIQRQLGQLLKKEEIMMKYRIGDKILNNQINTKRTQLMYAQLQKNADGNTRLLEKDIDKKVRFNKSSKDRSEGIRIRLVQEMVLAVKKHDNRMQSNESQRKRQKIGSCNQSPRLPNQKNNNFKQTERKKAKKVGYSQNEKHRIFASPKQRKFKQTSSDSKRLPFSPVKGIQNKTRRIS